MIDITMCSNKSCPIKFSCYRMWATPNPLGQSYSKFMPLEERDGSYTCDAHMPMTKSELKELVPNYKPTRKRRKTE